MIRNSLTSDLVNVLPSMSESFGSNTSWKGGNADGFLFSESSVFCNLLGRICGLSFKTFLSEWWCCCKVGHACCFCELSEKLLFRFLVTWPSLSNTGRRLLCPKLEKLPSDGRCSFDVVLGSLNPIWGTGRSSWIGWFSLGFLESLEGFPESLLKSLKALLDSFVSLEGLSLWSLDGLWSLRELLLMLFVVVRALLLLDPSCNENTTILRKKKPLTLKAMLIWLI